MKKKYQNGFFLFGLTVLILMVTQLDFGQVWEGLQRAGYWALAVIVLWAFLYMFNTGAWWAIIKSGTAATPSPQLPTPTPQPAINFWWLYKITVTGFALNYATPGGLMGGEPYRIMMLKTKIGTERASASVILYAMTHIFSHFWFWLLSCLLYLLTQRMTVLMWILLPAITAFCLLAIWFFLRGYKRGITVWMMQLLSHFPLVKRWAQPFFERNAEKLGTIDRHIAALHNQNRRTFITAVGLELACRVASALEIFFILLVIMPSANYLQCILILAFTSLFANMLFFIPLQLGGREGGFLMSAGGLGMTASAGIFVALIVRVRELIWTAIGLALIKLDKKSGTE
ncbi:MAG: flippase-like domain-containing protein [Prevotella sp.]|nr:flippase-like domain-containing protein [Prevotella sp.]